jgi:hypothetical protein
MFGIMLVLPKNLAVFTKIELWAFQAPIHNSNDFLLPKPAVLLGAPNFPTSITALPAFELNEKLPNFPFALLFHPIFELGQFLKESIFFFLYFVRNLFVLAVVL